MSTIKPLFIVLEGIDGSGKSTQLEMLYERMRTEHIPVVLTHEPTDFSTGKFIRRVLAAEEVVTPATMSGLFLADRLEHITHPEMGLLRRMEEGMNVLSGRYYFSSMAFQSEYVPMSWIAAANSLCKSKLKADFTFYMNLDPDICYERLLAGRTHFDIYENPDKLHLTHGKYMEAFDHYGQDENIIVLDADKTPEHIHQEIWNHLFPDQSK